MGRRRHTAALGPSNEVRLAGANPAHAFTHGECFAVPYSNPDTIARAVSHGIAHAGALGHSNTHVGALSYSNTHARAATGSYSDAYTLACNSAGIARVVDGGRDKRIAAVRATDG